MSGLIADPADKTSLSYRFRSKRDAILREFMLAARPAGSAVCRVADLGGGAAYWERVGLDWLRHNGFSITCINYDAAELTRDSTKDHTILLAVGDACNLDRFADNSFDVVHANSVIEHVGGWQRIKDFAREVRRLAPSYYIQTPNFWFPIDPHFYRLPMIHWLPPVARAALHRSVRTGWAPRAENLDIGMARAESNNMLSARQMRYLFPDAEIRYERVAFLRKSIIATRLAAADPTAGR